jgi:Holliday junction resolvase
LALNRVELGRKGEQEALDVLQKLGFSILALGNHITPYDVIATKDSHIFAINVKTGNSFSIHPRNLHNLIEYSDQNQATPALLLQAKDSYALFIMSEYEGWKNTSLYYGHVPILLPKALCISIKELVKIGKAVNVAWFVRDAVREKLDEIRAAHY